MRNSIKSSEWKTANFDSSFRLSARLNKLLVSFNELPVTFNELAEIGRNWLRLAKIARNWQKLAEIIENCPKFAEINENKPAPPRSTAVVLSLSLDDPNRRVFQNVGGFGRWPIMYRYFLRHIHASSARWCGRPEKRDHKNGSEELAWGAASKGSTPWELFLRCFKFESLSRSVDAEGARQNITEDLEATAV